MSSFVRVLKIIGRALRRALFAIGRFFKFTAKKMGTSSKTSRLLRKISKKEKAIESLYSEIGRNYYEAHSDAPEALLSELVDSVSENRDGIDETRDKITELRDAYLAAKAEAKEKAKTRRAADKKKAQDDKARANGELVDPEPEEAPAAAAVFSAPEQLIFEAPAEPAAPPTEEAPAAVPEEPAPVEEPVIEETPVILEGPAAEEAPVIEETPAYFEAPVEEASPAPMEPEAPAETADDAAPEPVIDDAPAEELTPAE